MNTSCFKSQKSVLNRDHYISTLITRGVVREGGYGDSAPPGPVKSGQIPDYAPADNYCRGCFDPQSIPPNSTSQF